MNTLMTIFFLFLSFSVFSKSVNLEVSSTLVAGDKTEKKLTKIRVELNKEFVLPSKNSKILMRVEELKGLARGPGGERPVLVSAEIYHINKGETELVSKPHIVTHIGKEASFKTTDYEGRTVELKINPTSVE